LRTAVNTLEDEKIQVLTDREAAVAAEWKTFWDYHLGHRKRRCELRAALEGVLNEIGARCLPYPEKGSTIGDVVMWFEKEIQTLWDAIAKANKNFLVYCLVGVLKMLQWHVNFYHIDGLGAIMNSSDASILDEVPDDIGKLAARIIKRWWSSYGLPDVTEAFRVELEVGFFITVLQYSWSGCLFCMCPVM
jgi:hypothetical protein